MKTQGLFTFEGIVNTYSSPDALARYWLARATPNATDEQRRLETELSRTLATQFEESLGKAAMLGMVEIGESYDARLVLARYLVYQALYLDCELALKDYKVSVGGGPDFLAKLIRHTLQPIVSR